MSDHRDAFERIAADLQCVLSESADTIRIDPLSEKTVLEEALGLIELELTDENIPTKRVGLANRLALRCRRYLEMRSSIPVVVTPEALNLLANEEKSFHIATDDNGGLRIDLVDLADSDGELVDLST